MSRPLYEHIQRRKELVKKCEDMLNEAKTKGQTELSPTRAAQVEGYMEEIKEINELVDEELCNWKSSEPILESPRNSMPMSRPSFGGGDNTSISQSIKAASKTYRGMFYGDDRAKVNNGGFTTFDDFLYAVHAGRADQRLIQCSMVEGTPSLGGFAVPEEYGAFLMDESLENEIIRPRATVWGMGSATKKVPAFDGAEHGNGLFGGITGQWLYEGETGIKSHGKLRLIQLTAKKLACSAKRPMS